MLEKLLRLFANVSSGKKGIKTISVDNLINYYLKVIHADELNVDYDKEDYKELYSEAKKLYKEGFYSEAFGLALKSFKINKEYPYSSLLIAKYFYEKGIKPPVTMSELIGVNTHFFFEDVANVNNILILYFSDIAYKNASGFDNEKRTKYHSLSFIINTVYEMINKYVMSFDNIEPFISELDEILESAFKKFKKIRGNFFENIDDFRREDVERNYKKAKFLIEEITDSPDKSPSESSPSADGQLHYSQGGTAPHK